jgi:hypothetical protein
MLAKSIFWNLSIIPENDDFAGVEPENVGYLGIGLIDFESKSSFGNAGRFYIDF